MKQSNSTARSLSEKPTGKQGELACNLENFRRRTESKVRRLEEEFKAVGGSHWEARGDRKRRQAELKRDVDASS